MLLLNGRCLFPENKPDLERADKRPVMCAARCQVSDVIGLGLNVNQLEKLIKESHEFKQTRKRRCFTLMGLTQHQRRNSIHEFPGPGVQKKKKKKQIRRINPLNVLASSETHVVGMAQFVLFLWSKFISLILTNPVAQSAIKQLIINHPIRLYNHTQTVLVINKIVKDIGCWSGQVITL